LFYVYIAPPYRPNLRFFLRLSCRLVSSINGLKSVDVKLVEATPLLYRG
jgi:hypothetical protein